MRSTLLLLVYASLNVGFMLPVHTRFRSAMQNLLCMNALLVSACTNGSDPDSWLLSASITTCTSISAAFSRSTSITLSRSRSKNAQWRDPRASSMNATNSSSQPSRGQKYILISTSPPLYAEQMAYTLLFRSSAGQQKEQ